VQRRHFRKQQLDIDKQCAEFGDRGAINDHEFRVDDQFVDHHFIDYDCIDCSDEFGRRNDYSPRADP